MYKAIKKEMLMKKLLLLSTLLLTIFSAQANESVSRTYIVNQDGTVTFLNRVIPNQDETGRTYIVNEDGTVTFLDRVAPPTMAKIEMLEDVRFEIRNTLHEIR